MKISPPKPDRHNVDFCDEAAIKHWVKHLGKTQEEIATAVERGGPRVRQLRKSSGLSRLLNRRYVKLDIADQPFHEIPHECHRLVLYASPRRVLSRSLYVRVLQQGAQAHLR